MSLAAVSKLNSLKIRTDMRNVPNHIIATLARCLPLILQHIDKEAMNKNLRLCNAVRQVKQLLPRINKIDKTNEQSR
jgi:hypothetical protein